MDPNQETENSEYAFELEEEETVDDSQSVDDFLKQLEAKEKDLHITAETTFIEIAADFEDDEVPDFMKQDLPAVGHTTLKPTASSPAPADSGAVKKLETEVSSLKAKISELEEARSELYKNSQRRLKDFETFKTRTERERRETFTRQLSNLATQMLPALDNLDRALQFASEMPEEKHPGFKQFFEGIVLVNQQVHEVLAGMGILPIATVGEEFDPHFHEAVAVDEESDAPPNTITAELLRGFRIGDNVIRHSMVKVSKPSAEQRAAETSQTAGDTETAESKETDFSEVDTQRLDLDMDSAQRFGSDGIEIETSNGSPLERSPSLERAVEDPLQGIDDEE